MTRQTVAVIGTGDMGSAVGAVLVRAGYRVVTAGRGRSAIGKVIGPSFKPEDMPDVVSRLIDIYIGLRLPEERFIDSVERLGIAPFKAGVYGTPLRSPLAASEEAVVNG